MIFVAACASVKTTNNSVAKKYTKYGVGVLPDTWRKEHFRGVDLLYRHVHSDATIYVTAQCDKVSDSPLEALTSQMLGGMGKYNITFQDRIFLTDREALVSHIQINIDGVNRFLQIMVLRKNRCVYDVVLSARQNSPEISKGFDDMIYGFWAEADL
jgi:hypothetical protein